MKLSGLHKFRGFMHADLKNGWNQQFPPVFSDIQVIQKLFIGRNIIRYAWGYIATSGSL